jgi:deazaflavin-dependent oxidoreductase (nitroreductase family)
VTLAAQLGYRHRPPNALQRAVRRVASTKYGAAFFSKVARWMDDVLLRVSKGRMTGPGVLAGLPTVFVTATGARSGQPRTVPLVGIPVGDALALIGTNFGQRSTPAWYHNLRANPDAEVSYRGRHARVRAREAVGAERDAIWRQGVETYAGYAAYQRRITHRDVHVMVLEPVDG